MCHSSNCLTAKDKPIVSQKVFLDFQKYPPSKLRNGTNGAYFKFSPEIAGPPRPLCQQTLASVVVLLFNALAGHWILFGSLAKAIFIDAKSYVCCVYFLRRSWSSYMIMIMTLTFSAKIVPTDTYLQATSASMGTTDLLYTGFHRKQLYIFGSKCNLCFLLLSVM